MENQDIGEQRCAVPRKGKWKWSKTKPFAQRFWSWVSKRGEDECWPWMGCKTTNGYGQISLTITGIAVMAHRVAWELTNGPIPPGLCVCHSCDRRECCNPKHLWTGTHQDNMHDMLVKGRRRSRTLHGEDNPLAKLTNDAVREIRRLYDEKKMSQCKMAKVFGVSECTIYGVTHRKRWRHLIPKT
jgi:hypothetical protein